MFRSKPKKDVLFIAAFSKDCALKAGGEEAGASV